MARFWDKNFWAKIAALDFALYLLFFGAIQIIACATNPASLYSWWVYLIVVLVAASAATLWTVGLVWWGTRRNR